MRGAATAVLCGAGGAAACQPCKLVVGDLVVTQACTGLCQGQEEKFTIVPLCDLPAGVTLFATDNGWTQSGTWRDREGWLELTTTRDTPAGTEVTGPSGWTPKSGSFLLTNNGDQVFAGFSKSGQEVVAFGVQLGPWHADSTDSRTSAKPTGAAGVAIPVGAYPNAHYSGAARGTPSSLLALLQDNTQWTVLQTEVPEPDLEVICPSEAPTAAPSVQPTLTPIEPTLHPIAPTSTPVDPTLNPAEPSASPRVGPAPPSTAPSQPPQTPATTAPTTPPTPSPTTAPTSPTPGPTNPPVGPSAAPAPAPSVSPTAAGKPTAAPTAAPTAPTNRPSAPTAAPAPPTAAPSPAPSARPTAGPVGPTSAPVSPTSAPISPTPGPINPTLGPISPTLGPISPTLGPINPTLGPISPTVGSRSPTSAPLNPTLGPLNPTAGPLSPSSDPTRAPAAAPTAPPLPPSPPPIGAPTPAPSAPPLRPTAPPHAAPPTPTAPPAPPSRPPTAAPGGAAGPPSGAPSAAPGAGPSTAPRAPTQSPTASPSTRPSARPSPAPARTAYAPTASPTAVPSAAPSPSPHPTQSPPLVEVGAPAVPPGGSVDSAVAGVVGAAGAGAAAGPLAMAMDTWCEQLGVERNMSRIMHPTGMVAADSQLLGCLVGNVLIFFCAAAFFTVLLRFIHSIDRDRDGVISWGDITQSSIRFLPNPVLRSIEGVDIEAVVRHPDATLFVTLFLYQGLCYAALHLLVHPQLLSGHSVPVWMRVIGGIASLLLLLYPAIIFRFVRHGVSHRVRRDFPELGPRPRARIRPWDDPAPPRWLQLALFSADGDWVSCRKQKHWLNRWQSAVRNYRERFAAPGMAVDLVGMWALALVSSLPTANLESCGHVRVAGAAVHLLQLLYCCRVRPYRCLRDNVLRCILLVSLILALMALAVGFYKAAADLDLDEIGSTSGSPIPKLDTSFGDAVLVVALVTVLLQVFLRTFAVSVLFIKGWRATLQRNEWAEFETRIKKLPRSDTDESGAEPSDAEQRAVRSPSLALPERLPSDTDGCLYDENGSVLLQPREGIDSVPVEYIDPLVFFAGRPVPRVGRGLGVGSSYLPPPPRSPCMDPHPAVVFSPAAASGAAPPTPDQPPIAATPAAAAAAPAAAAGRGSLAATLSRGSESLSSFARKLNARRLEASSSCNVLPRPSAAIHRGPEAPVSPLQKTHSRGLTSPLSPVEVGLSHFSGPALRMRASTSTSRAEGLAPTLLSGGRGLRRAPSPRASPSHGPLPDADSARDASRENSRAEISHAPSPDAGRGRLRDGSAPEISSPPLPPSAAPSPVPGPLDSPPQRARMPRRQTRGSPTVRPRRARGTLASAAGARPAEAAPTGPGSPREPAGLSFGAAPLVRTGSPRQRAGTRLSALPAGS
eukprot:TRINITY_DN12789_c0_g1_i1.p1 TRINITY_DN12789_c0_g1~~TRINITY_DN12789_c0_g1_i1.p1  ORF type:complete len:1399 (+),score=168.32 TRINITY_DN12789_c0_g1_i1:66-4262(+)